MMNPTAKAISDAIISDALAQGLAPQNIVFSPGARDSALLIYNTAVGGRIVSNAANIPAAPQKPFAPGWGLSFFSGNDDTANIAKNCGNGIGIVVKRYPWAQLESAEGVYSFGTIGQPGTIRDDVEATRLWNLANPTKKRQLVFMPEDRSYNTPKPSMLPLYLRNESWTNPVTHGLEIGYERPSSGGFAGLRWIPRVLDRQIALHAALAAELDGRDEVMGIATQETAHGFDAATEVKYGYTAQIYADSYKKLLTAASAAFFQSKIFWFFNFLEGGMNLLLDIAATIAALPIKNIYAGGPDLLPETISLTKPGFAYSMYPQMAALGIKMFVQLSPPGYSVAHSVPRTPTPYWTFKELHAYAVANLHVSFILAVPVNSGIYKFNSGGAGDLINLLPTLVLA